MEAKLLDRVNASRDERSTQASLERRLHELNQDLAELAHTATAVERAHLELQKAWVLLELDDRKQVLELARAVFDIFIENEQWQSAVEASELVYHCDCDDSVAALGMACWLAITYPVEPSTSLRILHHIIDETPDHSDGAAIAAVVAHYVVDLRAVGKEKESLGFLSQQTIAAVARRHRNIEGQENINIWMELLGLKDPDEFMPAMAKIIDTIVADRWWFDRDRLRARLPTV